MPISQLDALTQLGTVVVADTGDINSIKAFAPTDATTNPSLLLQAAQLPEYEPLVRSAIAYGDGNLQKTLDKLAVNFGVEIVGIVPGVVSTEVTVTVQLVVSPEVLVAVASTAKLVPGGPPKVKSKSTVVGAPRAGMTVV